MRRKEEGDVDFAVASTLDGNLILEHHNRLEEDQSQ